MWSLYDCERELKPLRFSNGKTQEDVVKEVIAGIDEGCKVIFIKGVCGTGKSAIALNLAKEIGKASIVVPVKNLQKQYEVDYMRDKYLLKDGKKLKIEIMTGRGNHKCPYLEENPDGFEVERELVSDVNSKLSDFSEGGNGVGGGGSGGNGGGSFGGGGGFGGSGDGEGFGGYGKVRDVSCDNSQLPCKIEIKDKNVGKIKEYVRKNPKVKITDFSNIHNVKRMSIAPVCDYWSPVVPAEIELNLDARLRSYVGLENRRFVIYQRKKGCSYYDQFNSCIDADVLIFNSQKYKLESLMNRKPATDVEIIDECDEFLDSFANQEKINLNRLSFALSGLFAEDEETGQIIDELRDLTRSILKDGKIEGRISNEDIISIGETRILKLLRYFLDSELMNHVECSEDNYCFHVEEVARTFAGFFKETYVSFYKEERDSIVKLVTTNLEKKFQKLLDKNKVFVMMSGTIHSDAVLKNVFGLSEFKIVEAETKMPGRIMEKRTGSEINCKYSNFQSGAVTREDYLNALAKSIELAVKPVLVHVNAFKDLPTEQEAEMYNLSVMTREKLRNLQRGDKVGEQAEKFKKGEIDVLYSTKCSRGVDFPGSTCNSIVLTKYPYPNVSSLFWRIFKRTMPQYYNSFYIDKARREFLQRIYRGLRSDKDYIFLLSPDERVFGVAG